ACGAGSGTCGGALGRAVFRATGLHLRDWGGRFFPWGWGGRGGPGALGRLGVGAGRPAPRPPPTPAPGPPGGRAGARRAPRGGGGGVVGRMPRSFGSWAVVGLAMAELVVVLNPFRLSMADPSRYANALQVVRDEGRVAVLGDAGGTLGNYGPLSGVEQPTGY